MTSGRDIQLPCRLKDYAHLLFLDQGAFADVYQAQDAQNSNYVAIKMLHEKYCDTDTKKDFLEEARILKMLARENSPYILRFIKKGTCGKRPYIVVQYASGGTLRKKIRNQQSRPFNTEQAITILMQIGNALSTVHALNIIHCDITPENILFDESNHALLADFGIAYQLPSNADGVQVRHSHGTYLYMAPERFNKMITRKGDQYSLGCIAYELFTGEHPLGPISSLPIKDKESMNRLHQNKIPDDPCNRNPLLARHIGVAIQQAIAKQPNERHTDIDAFMTSLLPQTSPGTSNSYYASSHSKSWYSRSIV